ncbi:MAG: ABC transporter permease [Candidatus Latescibacteria bacterium]|nr:ABC transporter permease [Candidatus Latescibacterota bacterium]
MLFNLCKAALHSLGHNKMRTFLTMLGIIIGVGAVIAMVGIGQGARSAVQAQISTLGTNLLMIFPGSTTQGGVRGGMGSVTSLTIDDAQAIAAECPAVSRSMPSTRTFAQVVFSNRNWNTAIQGVGPEFVDIRAWPVEVGSFITEDDVRTATKVCVLGKTVATNLFDEQNPVGQAIRIRNIPFTVIGVLARKGGSVMGADQDDMITAPYTTVQRRIRGRILPIGMIMASAVSDENLHEARQQITDLLRVRHRLTPGEDNDFTITSQAEIGAAAEESSKVMTTLLGSIASVSLIVGGIGIMNIMLVSVTERTREIGIRRAVGARRRDVLTQFLVEAIVISIIGGMIGIVLGLISSQMISKFAGWPSFITPDSILLAFLFSAVVGIFFGLYPAKKAAGLDPIEALRYE